MKPLTILCLLAFTTASLAAGPTVAPATGYRLSFDADGQAKGNRWVVHLRDADGNLSFEGALEGEWQQLSPEQKSYSHLFYSPSEAATLQVFSQDSGVEIQNVKLEKWEESNLLLNGDFSEPNYSGWSEHYNTEFVQSGSGKLALRVNLNGYALTDYTPVAGGGHYSFKGEHGTPGVQVLVYDSLRSFIGYADRPVQRRTFSLPEDAAYVRVLYGTGHNHLPAWRVNDISKAALVRAEGTGTAAPTKPERSRDWEIVLAAGCDPREEYAARELQRWISAITGKTPVLLAEPSKSEIRKIFVGRKLAAAFSDDLKTLEGTDGYAVRTKGGNLYLFGANPNGAIYGVNALLERNSDIIWPRPNPEFSAFYTRVPTLAFSDADFLSKPVFEERHVSGASAITAYDWESRNGLNSPWSLHKGNNYLAWLRGARLGYSGSFMAFLRKAREKDERISPMVDGKRDKSIWRQPCYTYQGTVDGLVASLRELQETLPGRETVQLHPRISDNWTVCGCADCMAPIKLPNGETLTAQTADATKYPLFFSTRNFLMLNKVAEALVPDYPDLKIRTHAYIFTAEPPAVKVHPAIIPEFAAYPTQNIRYPILAGEGKAIGGYTKDVWKRRFEEWGRVKKGDLGYFGYYYPAGFNAVADTAAADFRALADYEAVQVHTESFPLDDAELSMWDADAIEKWVMAKLMWDPAQDPEALRKEYIRRVYRGAEAEMARFYKLVRDSWNGAPESVFINCHTEPRVVFESLIIAPKLEDRAKQLLADAEGATQDPLVKKLIQRHRAYFEKLGGATGRVLVPLVEESTVEWKEPKSNHWEKGATIAGFLKVGDWRSFDNVESEHSSSVQMMRDGKNLYFRFKGNKAGAGRDQFELKLKNGKGRDFFLSVGSDGKTFAHPPLGNALQTATTTEGDGWTVVMAISLNVLGSSDPESSSIQARVGRLYGATGDQREESSHNGASIFNDHKSLWLNLQIK